MPQGNQEDRTILLLSLSRSHTVYSRRKGMAVVHLVLLLVHLAHNGSFCAVGLPGMVPVPDGLLKHKHGECCYGEGQVGGLPVV